MKLLVFNFKDGNQVFNKYVCEKEDVEGILEVAKLWNYDSYTVEDFNGQHIEGLLLAKPATMYEQNGTEHKIIFSEDYKF